MTSPLLSRSLRRRALLQAGAACLALPAWPPAAAQDPEAADSAPRWIDADGQARPAARTALALLAAAGDDGLDPLDYDADRLAARLPAGASRPDDPAAFEAALTRAMRRLLDDLHHGRVDPRSIHSDFTPPPRGAFDAGARLDAALAAGDLARAVREAAPTLQPYRALRAALARWRRLAADPAAWRETLPPLPGRSLAPGGRWAGVPLLERRLRAHPLLQDVSTDQQLANPQIDIDIDRDRAAAMGMTPEQIEEAFYTAYGTRQVSTIFAPNNQYQVIMELAPEHQSSVADLSALYVRSKDGRLAPLTRSSG